MRTTNGAVHPKSRGTRVLRTSRGRSILLDLFESLHVPVRWRVELGAVRREHSFHGPLNHVLLPLPSRHHSTAAPSPEHYGKRYELGCCANFAESPKGEVRRIPLPRTPVNKGIKRVGATIPWPFLA